MPLQVAHAESLAAYLAAVEKHNAFKEARRAQRLAGIKADPSAEYDQWEALRDAVTAALTGVKSVKRASITRAYDQYAAEVLVKAGVVVATDTGSYVVVKTPPTSQEYLTQRATHFTTTWGELIASAFDTFENLAGEMSDWYSNMPENFQNGDKGSAVEEAQQQLEDLTNDTDSEAFYTELTTSYLPGRGASRGDQVADACAKLQHIMEEAEKKIADSPDMPEYEKTTLGDLIDHLSETVNNAEGIEFPGMFG
jgi:hypothetical protein